MQVSKIRGIDSLNIIYSSFNAIAPDEIVSFGFDQNVHNKGVGRGGSTNKTSPPRFSWKHLPHQSCFRRDISKTRFIAREI